MKALVFLLVLANVLFFAFAQGYFGHPDNPDAGRIQKQVNADQLAVAGRGEAPGTDKTADKADEKAAPAAASTPPAPPVQTCLIWSDLSGADADKLASWLAEKFEDFKINRHAVDKDIKSWWVFIPPLPSKSEAEKKTAELKKLGIDDFLIVSDSGPNRWAISLGVFSSESGAQKRLANLKEKGVKSARTAVRSGPDSNYTVEARGPATRQQTVVDAAAGLKLDTRICK